MSARNQGTMAKLVDTAKRNPEGVLLLAAGAALLVRGINAASHAISSGYAEDDENSEGRRSGGLSRARRYAHDFADSIGGSVDQAASYAEDLGSSAYRASSRLVDDAGRTIRGGMTRVLEEQPLAMAVLGFAAGAVAAGSIPSTQIEGEALRPIRRNLTRTVDQAQGRLKKAARKAGRRLGEVVDERGLNAKGLEEAARDVADAFTDELTGGETTAESGQQSTNSSSGSSRSTATLAGELASSTAMAAAIQDEAETDQSDPQADNQSEAFPKSRQN